MSKLLRISRREYKIMLDHRLFIDRKPAVAAFHGDLGNYAQRLRHVRFEGTFETTDRRSIVFLDTVDRTIELNRFVFRERRNIESGELEYTLKCRSPDRYVAAGADVAAATQLKQDRKFEEDISTPFVARFSHSNTVKGVDKRPQSLESAGEVFPTLGHLERDGVACPTSVGLVSVNNAELFERVLKGTAIRFQDVQAEVAIIFWSRGREGRPLLAEFSFRYRSDDEDYSPSMAMLAYSFFERMQQLDWCNTSGKTKTQFAFGL